MSLGLSAASISYRPLTVSTFLAPPAYLQKALGWALEHNLDVMVDLHGVPGSQNSFDNSGVKNEGGPAWSKSDNNIYRSLQALGALTKIVTDPKYLGVVKAIEVLNEPLMDDTGKWGATWDKLSNYYLDAYDTIRRNETVIEGHPKTMVIFHDAFQKISNVSLSVSHSDYRSFLLHLEVCTTDASTPSSTLDSGSTSSPTPPLAPTWSNSDSTPTFMRPSTKES